MKLRGAAQGTTKSCQLYGVTTPPAYRPVRILL